MVCFWVLFRFVFEGGKRQADGVAQGFLWEHIPDIVTEIDTRGTIIGVNHTVTGRSKDDVIGTNSYDHLDENNKAIFQHALNRAISSKTLQTYDIKVNAPVPPGYIYLACRIIPIVNKERVDRLLVVSSDVTSEFVIREELKLARDKAEEASGAKTRFLASMSHEIRTPMTGMLGMASLLQETSLTNEQQEYVDTIQTSANHLLSIVNDILDFSKIEANKLSIETEEFDNPKLINEIQGLLATKVNEKGLKMICQVSPDVPKFLVGDAIRIRQVLMNYLTNSIKFTEQGDITLKVALLKRNEQSVRIRYSVEDTGIGIETEKTRYLFEEYTGVHDRASTLEGGSGLGLSICHRLAELMQGKVGVISKEGVGSNFWLDIDLPISDHVEAIVPEQELPVEQVPDQKASPAEPEEVIREEQQNSNIHILLAEDNPVNQLVVVKILKRLGCETTTVANGKEAVDHCEEHHYDLIFMDCHMPVMDGMMATENIRLIPAYKKTPIIALTADVMSERKDQALACGMSSFLSKPIKIKDIEEVLVESLPQFKAPNSNS